MSEQTFAVLTGPIDGNVTLADGTVVDVNEYSVPVASAEQAAEVAHLVAARFEVEGHPKFLSDPDVDFVHVQDPAFADYVPHEAMAEHLETMRGLNSDLAARVEKQRRPIEAAAAEMFAARDAGTDQNQEG